MWVKFNYMPDKAYLDIPAYVTFPNNEQIHNILIVSYN